MVMLIGVWLMLIGACQYQNAKTETQKNLFSDYHFGWGLVFIIGVIITLLSLIIFVIRSV